MLLICSKMPKRALSTDLPYPVTDAVKRLGRNLRTARVRRNLSQDALAAKIGVNRRVIADAENGKLGTAIGIYVALLWAMNLESQVGTIADPERGDPEGAALARTEERRNPAAASRSPLDNDF